jgi:hypothetical protein
MRKTILLVLAVSLGLAGCSSKNPLSPALTTHGSGVHTFVLNSPADPRLPAPMREVTGATAADWVGLRGAMSESKGGRVSPVAADPASCWSQQTTQLGLRARLPQPLFARAYALTQIAVFDALAAAQDARRGRLPENTVAAGAASVVLIHLFPNDADQINANANIQAGLTHWRGEGARARAWALGRKVGRLVVERARKDGSDAVFKGPVPTGDCTWAGTRPVLPMCGMWQCWVVASGGEYQPEPPYGCASPEDLRDVEEVYQLSRERTPEQIATVRKWADLPLAAVWNNMLIQRVAGRRPDALASARGFAYLNAAMYDAFVSCWRAGYTYWTARPLQRRPGLTTVVPTPNFPAYPSMHTSVSGAAAGVLGEIFPREQDYFAAQVNEAAMSRLWGGVQFRHDNDQGLIFGRKIGDQAVLRLRGDTPMRLIASR